MKFKINLMSLCVLMLLLISGCSSCQKDSKNNISQPESSIEESETTEIVNSEEPNESTDDIDINLETEQDTETIAETETSNPWTETFEDSNPQMVLCGRDPVYFTGSDLIRGEVFWEIKPTEIENDFETMQEESQKFEDIDARELVDAYIKDIVSKGYSLTFDENDIIVYSNNRFSAEFDIQSEDSFVFTVKSLI